MKPEIRWLETSHELLYVRMPTIWRWDDLLAYSKRINRILNRYSRPVIIVLDFHHSPLLPTDTLLNCRKLFITIHPTSAEIILTGLSLSHKLALDVVFRLFPHLKNHVYAIDNLIGELGMKLHWMRQEETPVRLDVGKQ